MWRPGLEPCGLWGPGPQDGRIRRSSPSGPPAGSAMPCDLVIRRQSERRTGPDGQAGVHRLDDAQQNKVFTAGRLPVPVRTDLTTKVKQRDVLLGNDVEREAPSDCPADEQSVCRNLVLFGQGQSNTL